MNPVAANATPTAAAKIANASEWPGQPPQNASSSWGICTSIYYMVLWPTRVFVQNGMSFSSAAVAQHTVECAITLQWSSMYPPKNCPYPLGDRVPI